MVGPDRVHNRNRTANPRAARLFPVNNSNCFTLEDPIVMVVCTSVLKAVPDSCNDHGRSTRGDSDQLAALVVDSVKVSGRWVEFGWINFDCVFGVLGIPDSSDE